MRDDDVGPNGVSLTLSQDATCQRCDGAKHPTQINGRRGPKEFHHRPAIYCGAVQEFVAKLNYVTESMEVVRQHVGYVHLSAPPVIPWRARGGMRFIGAWRAGRDAFQPPAPAAVPAPGAAAAAPPTPTHRKLSISLEMLNHHTTEVVGPVMITPAQFTLSALPEHILRRLRFSDAVPASFEVLLENRWRKFDCERAEDVSHVRNQPTLYLRAISTVFPLHFACDMADGLRKYALTCAEDPGARPDHLFERAFSRTPWPVDDSAFVAIELWESLPRGLQDKYSVAPRSEEFTWARVVGAADVSRHSARRPTTHATHAFPGGSQKRKRGDDDEEVEIVGQVPQPRVKREPSADRLPHVKKPRRSPVRRSNSVERGARASSPIIIEISDDDEP